MEMEKARTLVAEGASTVVSAGKQAVEYVLEKTGVGVHPHKSQWLQQQTQTEAMLIVTRTRRLFEEFWSQGNADIVRDLVDEQCRIADLAHPTMKLTGPNGMCEYVGKTFHEPFPDFQVQLKKVLPGEGNRVTVTFAMSGTHMAPLDLGEGYGVINPCGTKMEITGVAVSEWNKETLKMTRFTLSYDFLALIRYLGFEMNQNKRVTRRILEEVIGQGNIDRAFLETLVWQDFEILNPATPFLDSKTTGADALIQCYNLLGTAFSNLSIEIVDMFGAGDKVVVHWKSTGVHTGTFLEHAATNKKFEVSGIDTWTFVSGKAKMVIVQWDMVNLYKQLGVFTPNM